jgi:hypothetical protein
VLGTLQLTLMAILGIRLWSGPQRFGLGNRNPLDFEDVNALVLERANISILGRRVPFSSSTLRDTSIAIYVILLVPGLNLILPMAFFLAVHLVGRRLLPFAKKWDSLPACISLVILVTINIVFIVNIELTRIMNITLQSDEEAQWGFGQIMAMIMLHNPLFQFIKAVGKRLLEQRRRGPDQDVPGSIAREDFSRNQQAISRGCPFPSPKSRGMSTIAIYVLRLNARQMSTYNSGSCYWRMGASTTFPLSTAPR